MKTYIETPQGVITESNLTSGVNHRRAWNFVLRRLLSAQNESNVKTYLDKAVANGKITVDQENKVLSMWEVLHTPAPTTTTPATTTTSP